MRIDFSEFQKLKAEFKAPREIKILTGSMAPFIKPQDKVVVAPVANEQLRPFDPIVFWQNDKLMCHFFYGRKPGPTGELLIAKALNGKSEDPPFPQEHLFGVVLRPVLPKWKRWLMKFLL